MICCQVMVSSVGGRRGGVHANGEVEIAELQCQLISPGHHRLPQETYGRSMAQRKPTLRARSLGARA